MRDKNPQHYLCINTSIDIETWGRDRLL